MRMLNDRNLVAPTYNEAVAVAIFANVCRYLAELRRVQRLLADRYVRDG